MKKLLAILLAFCGLAALAQQVYNTPDGMFEYAINDDGLTATIVNYKGPSGPVTIPQTIDGLLVTTIGEAAFFNKGLTGTLTIPSGLRRIELDAFNANHGLTRVDIPASVNYIHPDAFTYCDGVLNVYLYHIYPNIVDPPLFHELDWADPTASSFAGNHNTIIHLMQGTIEAHMEGALPSGNVAIRKWLEQNEASIIDDIDLPSSLQFAIDDTGYGVVYSTTGWIVPDGIVAQAVVWDDITTKSRDGADDEERDTPSQVMHYGWDAANPWIIETSQPTHKYLTGETVPKGCGVIVKGKAGEYTAQLDYNAPLVPFRNLLHGRDFPSVADFPSTATDDVVCNYRFGRLQSGDNYGFLWERFIVHGTEQDKWTQDDGKPFVAEPNKPWLTLTSDNEEGDLMEPQDAHFFLTFSNKVPTAINTVVHDGNDNAGWSDLMGRHFSQRPSTAGIYIHNGKKIIIK